MELNILKITIKTFVFVAAFVLVSCSVQSKLNRKYEGKTEAFLIGSMGKPAIVYMESKDRKVDVYEKKTILRKTPISTGGFKYDRFDSPQATKVETFKFSINTSGIVEKVEYDYRYER
jgi:hypothetical protein